MAGKYSIELNERQVTRRNSPGNSGLRKKRNYKVQLFLRADAAGIIKI